MKTIKKFKRVFGIGTILTALVLVLLVTPIQTIALEGKDLGDVASPMLEDYASLMKTMRWGEYYNNSEAVICVPNTVDSDTKICVYYAGGTGGNLLGLGFFEYYFKNFNPNCIFILFKNSHIYGIGRESNSIEEQTANLLNAVCNTYACFPKTIQIAGSSNGGYTTFHAASYLYENYGFVTDKIMILDMGQNWYKDEYLITEEKAQPMVEMGTVVYHFGRAGEIFVMPGAVKFAGYGVPLVEVACKSGGHDAITNNAINYGLFSWLIGEDVKPDESLYTFTNVNF